MHRTAAKNSGWKNLFGKTWFLAINLFVLGFVGWSYLREVSNGNGVERQLTDLKRQADQLEAKNEEYETLLKKAGTKSFVERQARLSLGYQNPGEKELYLTTGGMGTEPGTGAIGNAADLTNPQKWWKYFFGAER